MKTKKPEIVTPIVIEHLKYFAKRNGNKTQDYELWSDKGQEFDHKVLKPHVKKTKFVKAGASCENRNRLFQSCFYRILKNRQSVSVKNAIKKSQDQINNTMSKIHRATPNEVVDKKVDTLKQYNKTRKEHVSSLKRKPLEVGDHVRIQIKSDKDVSVGFKSYKGITFSNQVYTIDRRTKKLPHKYYIKPKRKWFLADKLLKSAPRDEKSKELIAQRDDEQKIDDDREEKRQDEDRKKKQLENDKRVEELKQTGKLRRTRRGAAEKLRAKLKAQKEQEKMLDELLASPKKKGKRKRKKYFKQKNDDEEWVPS